MFPDKKSDDTPKKRKTDSFEISFSKTDMNGVDNMDGVYEYLPSHTMTAEERARHRVDKRKSRDDKKKSSLQAAADRVQIDQNSDILCEGQMALWDSSDSNN